MRVIAVQRGFDNTQIREIGDEFDVPECVLTEESWCKPISAESRKEAAEAKELVEAEERVDATRKGDAYPNNMGPAYVL